MAEFLPPTNAKEFDANFAQIKPMMNATEALYESSRCLFCFDAPCVQACPTAIDIPLFIRQINSNNNSGAARTIYEANYFGHACGKICPTEVLCEGACVYNHQNVKPLEIGRLQSFATSVVIKKGHTDKTSKQFSEVKLFESVAENGMKVAIIGAGPAGISCACELRRLGYQVDIFEGKELPGGLTLHGVAPYKITNEEVLREIDWLQTQFSFTIIYNRKIVNADDFVALEQNYQAIFLGVGLGETREMEIANENLLNCIGATEFIENIKLKHEKAKMPANVIVIGGGNTAMDAASEAARMGAESVTLVYRRSKENMSAYPFEYDLAKAVGVQGIFRSLPIAIIGKDKIQAVQFIRTKEKDNKIESIPGSEFTLPCDLLIKATGQSRQTEMLRKIEGLVLNEKGCISIDAVTRQTTNPKYFAGGDAVNGGAEVVNAAAEGKAAAKGIHQLLKS